MQDADFRARQALADLSMEPSLGKVQDPATVLVGSDGPVDVVRAAMAKAIASCSDAARPDPFLADMWQLNHRALR